MIIGFHHGLGDFIVFSCLLDYLPKDTLFLCRKDFCYSEFIKCYPDYNFDCKLDNPWVRNKHQVMASNLKWFNQYNGKKIYIPNMRFPHILPKWKFFANLLSINIDLPDFKLFFKPDNRPSEKKILFLHNKVPLHPYNSFNVNELLKEYSDYYIFDTSKSTEPSILYAFNWLYHADVVIVADSVFYWAALAFRKSINYLYFGRHDPRVYPPKNYRNLIIKSNRKF